MSVTPTTLEKRTTWARLYNAHFEGFREFQGETPQTITGTPTVDMTTTDGQLLCVYQAFSGPIVQFFAPVGGTVGFVYVARVTVTTSGGSTLTIDCDIPVVA